MGDLGLDDFYFDDSFIKNDMADIDLSGLTGGKHFRSRLLYLAGQIFSLNDDDLLKLGRVVELVHNATLTHDDVIDNSHTRRGAPSVPALINNKKSVLLGDYMLAKALHELSDFSNPALTQELTLTLKELVEGEWIQYENTDPYEISYKLYETLAIKKTGSLFRWCFLAPLVAAKGDEVLYKLFSEFGEELGIIFQMTDDVIDFNKESKKSYGLDFRNNNINFVLQFVGTDFPEYHKKFLQTDDITDLNETEFTVIMTSLDKANGVIKVKLDRCKGILNLLKEKLEDTDQAPLEEFEMVLDLITDRVF
jgi:octaprenyl-diphosphate synthase